MKRVFLLTCCLILGTMLPLNAQPKRGIKTLARAVKANKQTEVTAAINRTQKALTKAALGRISAGKREALVNRLFEQKAPSIAGHLPVLQGYQKKYGAWDFFDRFITRYYRQHFGQPSPGLATLFTELNRLNNPALQRQAALRLEYLIKNKQTFIRQLWPEGKQPFVTLNYIQEDGPLTAANFQATNLVYNCEIAIEPGGFIPFDQETELSTFLLEGTPWHIAGFSGGLENLPQLYRFLITQGDDFSGGFNVVWDKQAQSLLLSSPDNTTYLRIARHEYNTAHRLHLHLYRIIEVNFINTAGKKATQKIMLNISIPISSENPNPRIGLKEWFVTFPLREFLKDPNVYVTEGKVF